jgi:hypothetical protein
VAKPEPSLTELPMALQPEYLTLIEFSHSLIPIELQQKFALDFVKSERIQ